ncbi:MAG: leucine-rich repeat domain-containing protein [Alloprevotella sp.]|nr:leucine-rich repeat domain-containing protein [Alloprevotella sp.]
MKKLLLLLLLATAVLIPASAQQVTVRLETAGTLPEHITEETKYTIRNLRVEGELNGTDIRLLRDMAGRMNVNTATKGQLDTLDLSAARIVSGGEPYFTWAGQEYRTADDVLPPYFLLYCRDIKSFQMPESLRAIGDQALASCESLEEIVLPEGLDSIGLAPFINCDKVEELIVPDNVTKISHASFQRMGGLKRITLGAGIRSIDTSSFVNDDVLECITLGKNLTEFDALTFYTLPCLQRIETDEENPSYTSIDGVLFTKDKATLFYHPGGRDEETYVIPASVTTLREHCFAANPSLTAMDIPSSVQTIGLGAFLNCGSLQTVTLHEGLRTVGTGAFGSCENLMEIEFPASVETVEGGVFLACNALERIRVAADSEHFTTQDGALYDKEMRTLISFPCGYDTEFYEIPGTVETIDSYAFACHPTLKNAYLPPSVRTVGEGAFFACPQLLRLIFSEGIDSIATGVLDLCDKMDAVFFLGATPPGHVDDYALYNDRLYELGALYVPEAALEDYKAKQWVVLRELGYSEQLFKYISGLTDADIAEITGIRPAVADYPAERLPEVYTLDGRHAGTLQRGINILRRPDGTSQKFLLK